MSFKISHIDSTDPSDSFRTASSAEQVNGTAWTTERIIEVDPLWLAMPGSLWFITTVFLFTTIWLSRKNDAPIWKSSTLAVLKRMDSSNVSTLKDMQKDGERKTVRLFSGGEGWQLREAGISL